MERLVERELIVPVRFSRREIERIDKAVERVGAKSRSALIREATQNSFRRSVASKSLKSGTTSRSKMLRVRL